MSLLRITSVVLVSNSLPLPLPLFQFNSYLWPERKEYLWFTPSKVLNHRDSETCNFSFPRFSNSSRGLLGSESFSGALHFLHIVSVLHFPNNVTFIIGCTHVPPLMRKLATCESGVFLGVLFLCAVSSADTSASVVGLKVWRLQC